MVQAPGSEHAGLGVVKKQPNEYVKETKWRAQTNTRVSINLNQKNIY